MGGRKKGPVPSNEAKESETAFAVTISEKARDHAKAFSYVL